MSFNPISSGAGGGDGNADADSEQSDQQRTVEGPGGVEVTIGDGQQAGEDAEPVDGTTEPDNGESADPPSDSDPQGSSGQIADPDTSTGAGIGTGPLPPGSVGTGTSSPAESVEPQPDDSGTSSPSASNPRTGSTGSTGGLDPGAPSSGDDTGSGGGSGGQDTLAGDPDSELVVDPDEFEQGDGADVDPASNVSNRTGQTSVDQDVSQGPDSAPDPTQTVDNITDTAQDAVGDGIDQATDTAADVGGNVVDTVADTSRAAEEAVRNRLQDPLAEQTRQTSQQVAEAAGVEDTEQVGNVGESIGEGLTDPFADTVGAPASAIEIAGAAPDAGEAAGELGADVGESVLEGDASDAARTTAEAGTTAAEVGAKATAQAVAEDPVRLGTGLATGAVLGVASGRALYSGGRIVRDRVRTAGAQQVDAEDLVSRDVLEGRERFPSADNPDLVRDDPAEAITQQANEMTPDEIRTQFDEAGVEGDADLVKALDTEPQGPGRGRSAQGISAPEADSDLAGEFETAGTSLGPELSTNFLRTNAESPDFSMRPGLPDLGNRPTAVVARTDVENPSARTTAEFDTELREASGDTTARAVRDEFEGFSATEEAEAQLPPGAELVDVGSGPLRDSLRRAGVGSDFATEIDGRRVPIRTVAPEDRISGGSPGPLDLLDDTRAQAGGRPTGTRVSRDLSRQASDPGTVRPTPTVPSGGVFDEGGPSERLSRSGGDGQTSRPGPISDPGSSFGGSGGGSSRGSGSGSSGGSSGGGGSGPGGVFSDPGGRSGGSDDGSGGSGGGRDRPPQGPPSIGDGTSSVSDSTPTVPDISTPSTPIETTPDTPTESTPSTPIGSVPNTPTTTRRTPGLDTDPEEDVDLDDPEGGLFGEEFKNPVRSVDSLLGGDDGDGPLSDAGGGLFDESDDNGGGLL